MPAWPAVATQSSGGSKEERAAGGLVRRRARMEEDETRNENLQTTREAALEVERSIQ